MPRTLDGTPATARSPTAKKIGHGNVGSASKHSEFLFLGRIRTAAFLPTYLDGSSFLDVFAFPQEVVAPITIS